MRFGRRSRNARWGKTPGALEEIQFLQGPQRRSFELWRTVRICGEFLRGFRALHFVGPCVTVFGSARFPETHQIGRASCRERVYVLV